MPARRTVPLRSLCLTAAHLTVRCFSGRRDLWAVIVPHRDVSFYIATMPLRVLPRMAHLCWRAVQDTLYCQTPRDDALSYSIV